MHAELLRRMWNTHSAAQIATALKAVGGDYSRDAVTSKAQRLGLSEAKADRTVPGYITLPLGYYWEPARRRLWRHRPPDEPPRTNGNGQYELDIP